MKTLLLSLSALILAISAGAQTGTIKGTAKTSTNQTVDDGQVVLLQYKSMSDLTPAPHMMQLDPQGGFEFSELTAGFYKVVVEPGDLFSANFKTTYFPNSSVSTTTDFINVKDGASQSIEVKLEQGQDAPPPQSSPKGVNHLGDPIPGMDVSLEQIPGDIYGKIKKRKEQKAAEKAEAPKYEAFEKHGRICVKYTDETLQKVTFVFTDDAGNHMGRLSTGVADLIPGSTLTSYPLLPGEYYVRTEQQPQSQAHLVKIK